MFGNKLRSWMEAVRPRKKQQRKEKHQQQLLQQQQKLLANGNGNGVAANSGEFISKFKTVPSTQQSTENDMANVDSKSMQTIATRYSGANLSSPESAYSTGYSTDGTSPGAPPPEYYINIRTGTRYFPSEANRGPPVDVPSTKTFKATVSVASPTPTVPKQHLPQEQRTVRIHSNVSSPQSAKKQPTVSQVDDRQIALIDNNKKAVPNVVVPSGVMSPRQRNRIRTNPWVPGATISPCSSSVALHLRPELTGTLPPVINGSTPNNTIIINSPVPARYLSPTSIARGPQGPINRAPRCASLSSSAASSCSSLSAASLQWDANLVRDAASSAVATRLFAAVSLQAASARFHSTSDDNNEPVDDDDDCTLNEMMGKYDESYVYEKETDILSDSDPTDCETDIDTGQDGGDEDEPAEGELDFIDNGSLLEFSTKDARNTGHCTYHTIEIQQRRCSSRRRTARKSEKRRRSSNSKKRHAKNAQLPMSTHAPHLVQGTRSAGATPVSVRRTKLPISKLAIEDDHHTIRKRSNSVCIPRCVANDSTPLFDQRDKEADRKYKELIVEAEHILLNMKCNNTTGLSPRRVPNKRVELLRTENTKSEHHLLSFKNRLIEEMARLPIQPPPPAQPASTFSPRFSPKRNHITKFINSNSPILMRRDDGKKVESPLANRRPTKGETQAARRSPKYRKKALPAAAKKHDDFSSDSDGDTRSVKAGSLHQRHLPMSLCPQSEPVKRKIYNSNQSKTVAFNVARRDNIHTEISMSIKETSNHRKSCESLRQQVLLNTISSLKKSLEDQSASLKQVYESSQNLHT